MPFTRSHSDALPSGSPRAMGLLLLYASTLFGLLAAASAPTPLYPLYQQSLGFSDTMLTVIFAVYALALLATLLITGALSDFIGRRPVIVAALLLQGVSMWIFHEAGTTTELLMARLLQGVATGLATSVLGAALVDIDTRLGGLLAVACPMLGLSSGILGSSLLVDSSTTPFQSIYEILLALYSLQAMAIVFDRERVVPRPGALSSLRPAVAVPQSIRAMIWRIAPINMAGWALCGFYLALMPALSADVLASDDAWRSGVLIFLLPLTGGLVAVALRHRGTAVIVRIAGIAMITGLSLMIAGTIKGHASLLALGGVASGIGFGAGFLGTKKAMLARAPIEQRSGVISLFFLLSYLPFSLPVILAGIGAQYAGLVPTTIGFASLLGLICAWVLWKSRSLATDTPTGA